MQKDNYQPVCIIDEKIGTFTLNAEFSWFENAEFQWLGQPCEVYLETDKLAGNTAEQSYQHFLKLQASLKQWDEKFRKFSAENLTASANEWQSEGEEEPVSAITEEKFAERMKISSVSVSPNGDLTVYYHDDNMFWGHSIEISANISGKIESASIAG